MKADKQMNMRNETDSLNNPEKQIISYTSKHLPLACQIGLPKKPDITAHWHEEIEILYILENSLTVRVDKKTYFLKKDSVFFINSRQVHQLVEGNCKIMQLQFDSSLFLQNYALQQDFIRPILLNSQYHCYNLTPDSNYYPEMKNLILSVKNCFEKQPPAYQLRVIGFLHCGMALLFEIQDHAEKTDSLEPSDFNSVENMYSYIVRFYPEKIHLEDIAKAGNVCRSKCCQLFNRYFHMTPMQFLNKYRLTVSRNLIISTPLPSAEIAASCGFPNQSYYIKIFTSYFGMTPAEFRRKNIRETSLPDNNI